MPIKGQPIPWPRILAEGAAIVVSILLAFAIDAAWQHRGEIAPFLAERGIPRVLCPEGEWACAPDDTIPRDYVELSENPQFRALLLFRRGLMWMAAADHEQATVEANELLAMISDRLDALGG
jgi:hypothetical protein